ncbi:MAG: sulfatase-like hydrolase/transferase [Dyadobacter sp.]|uniref:sulfatase-like hydrolase/transferase n=1 Tax=Dyadobacter sp. TaxID=1914288 RepID=UPI001B03EDF6|nr:sulfatase-like hydrolase/transferase [Dyadobacter sp.]MBO9612642.1 sulfatase-like hydrolase/transferase [Dyadobacter sp.]
MFRSYPNLSYTVLMLLLATSALLVFRKKSLAEGTARQPNVIYILADDLGSGDLSCLNSNSQISTPNLDKLASNGLVFTDAHSGSAVCTPTRYGILTGRYAFRSRLKKGVLGGYSPMLIENDRFTVADLMKKAGYRTGVVGKWHLGLDWVKTDASKTIDHAEYDADWTRNENLALEKGVTAGPNDLGFDHSFIIPASLDIAPYVYLQNGKPLDPRMTDIAGNKTPRGVFWRDGKGSQSFDVRQTLDIFGQEAKKFISESARNQSRPFFLYLPLSSPHTPWLPSEAHQGSSKAGIYGDFVHHTDAVVGTVMHLLDSLGIANNTLVIFTSDNGADWKPGDQETYPAHRANYIYRGEKSDIWEGGHRVPFILRWPAVVKKGGKSAQTICLTDLMATLASITGQKLGRNAGQDSFSFAHLLRSAGDRAPVRPSVIHHSIDGMFAIRRGQWKFIDGKGSGGWSSKGEASDPEGQLYNIENDPSETTNLFEKQPEIAKELKALLEKQKAQGYTRPL